MDQAPLKEIVKVSNKFTKRSKGFLDIATTLDILGLIFASAVFLCGFFHLPDYGILFGVRTVEFLGIVFALLAIYLMWHHFNNEKTKEKVNPKKNKRLNKTYEGFVKKTDVAKAISFFEHYRNNHILLKSEQPNLFNAWFKYLKRNNRTDLCIASLSLPFSYAVVDNDYYNEWLLDHIFSELLDERNNNSKYKTN